MPQASFSNKSDQFSISQTHQSAQIITPPLDPNVNVFKITDSPMREIKEQSVEIEETNRSGNDTYNPKQIAFKNFVDQAFAVESSYPPEKVYKTKGENTVQLERLGYKMESEDKNSCGVMSTISPPQIYTSGIQSKRLSPSRDTDPVKAVTSAKVVLPPQASFLNNDSIQDVKFNVRSFAEQE